MTTKIQAKKNAVAAACTETPIAHSKVVSFINQKGGVGKTSLTFQYAHYLNELGYRVAIIDLDGQGNLTHNFFEQDVLLHYVHTSALDLFTPSTAANYQPLQHASGIDVIGTELNSHFLTEVDTKGLEVIEAFYENVKAIAAEYDFVLIDTPPAPGIRTSSACATSDYIFAPVSVDEYGPAALVGLMGSIKNIGDLLQIELNIAGILINNFIYEGPASKGFLLELEQLIGPDLLIPTTMRRSVSFGRAKREGRPVWHLRSSGAERTASQEALVVFSEMAQRIPEIDQNRVENFMEVSKAVRAIRTKQAQTK